MFVLGKFLLTFLISITLPLITLHIFHKIFGVSENRKTSRFKRTTLPKPYPIIGHLIPLLQHKGEGTFEWFSALVVSSPLSTFVLHRPLGGRSIFTGHPVNVEHILKTRHDSYNKGPHHKDAFQDVFGDSLVTQNGDAWKFQRQVSSHMFSPRSLQNFIENIIDFELEKRLIPFLSNAANTRETIDLQQILKRFTFDTICSFAFDYDPEFLSPSLPHSTLSKAFDDATTIIFARFTSSFQIIWKICRLFNIGREKQLKLVIKQIREFAAKIIEHEKHSISSNTTTNNNLLSRLLKHEHLSENLIIDIILTFIFAGLDPTSAGLTWFFWLIHKNKRVEDEIIKEISTTNHTNKLSTTTEELKQMVYMHAALCETMRLYPPVPMDTKQADTDDLLPDGTRVKKGMLVNYLMYAMGRSESIWGPTWAEFRPERWLKEAADGGERRFVGRDPFSYPVFNAGPRTCLGKDMALMQMKRVVGGVLRRFRVVPMMDDGVEPVYVASLTAKMDGGFPVRIYDRSLVE